MNSNKAHKHFRIANKSPEEIKDYFKDLTPRHLDLEEFKHHLKALNRNVRRGQDLSICLKMMANAFKKTRNINKKSEFKDFLDGNIHLWIDAAEKSGLENFPARSLATMMWSLATINVWPGRDFVSKWGMAAGKYLHSNYSDRFNAIDMAQITHALCLFDAQYDHIDMADTIDHMLELMEDMDDLDHKQLHVYEDACHWVGRPVTMDIPPRGNTMSRSEGILADWLKKAGADLELGRYIPCDDVGHIVDIPMIWDDKPVLAEYDGPTHFNRHPHHSTAPKLAKYDASTAFQTRLLRTLHPDMHVLRIRYTEFDLLEGMKPEHIRLHLRSMLNDLVAQPPGCYVSEIKGTRLKARPMTTTPKRVIINGPSSRQTADTGHACASSPQDPQNSSEAPHNPLADLVPA